MVKAFAPVKIGPKRSRTPEGFLVCHDVAIARCGTMVYAHNEVPVEAGPDPYIKVDRGPDEVFRPETIASFQGKPVTIQHPDEDVSPANWRMLTVGVVMDPRRGEGIEDDFLFADLMITAQEGIDALDDGIEEVSCGYDADYGTHAPGHGFQRNIIGNHVALVERGRCGPRCAVGDQDMSVRAPAKKTKFMDKVAKAFGFKDAEEMEKAATDDSDDDEDDAEAKKTADAIAKASDGLRKEFRDGLAAIAKTLDEALTDIKGVPTGDEDDDTERTNDEDADEDEGSSTKDTAERLAIVAPDLKIPTHDSADRKATRDAICSCQRKALAAARVKDATLVDQFTGGAAIDKLSPARVDAAFVGVAELMRARNTDAAASGLRPNVSTRDFGRKPPTIAEINEINRKAWADRASVQR